MAINFPNSPSNGDTHTAAGQTFTYDGTAGVWNAAASSGGGGGGGGVTSYANLAAFPSSGNTGGDLAFAQDTGAVYVWDGSEWDRMAAGSDESPVILTDPPTTHDLDHTGGTTTVTMTAQDPEGFDIEYGIAYNTSNNARPSQLSADTTINQTTGAYTFTPSSTGSDAGSFKARLSASDGVKSSVRTVSVALAFDALGELLLAAGGGGGNSWGGGGGGAGGLVLNTNYTFTAGVTNTIVVGTGGAASRSVQATRGDNGTDSTFTAGSTLVYTSVGGGGGGGYPADNQGDGGSGGGTGRAGIADNGVSTQNAYGGVGFGHDGSAVTYSNKGGGGGGGAGGPGQGATTSAGGDGGAGKASTITGSSVFYSPGGPAGGYSTSIGSYVSGTFSNYGAGGNGGNYSAAASRDGAAGVCIIATQQAATATTGSPTVDTSSRSGWYVYTFTSNGTITF